MTQVWVVNHIGDRVVHPVLIRIEDHVVFPRRERWRPYVHRPKVSSGVGGHDVHPVTGDVRRDLHAVGPGEASDDVHMHIGVWHEATAGCVNGLACRVCILANPG